MTNCSRRFGARIGIFCGLIVASVPAAERQILGENPAQTSPVPANDRLATFLQGLLPIAWQRQPRLRFNAITEMTPEGRKRRVPTPAAPMHFYAEPARFVQTGELISAGEKPPPGSELEAAMRKALAENGYLPIPNDHQRPDVVIVFTYGSSGSPIFEGTATANESLQAALLAAGSPGGREDLRRLVKDVVERGRLVAGEKFAVELHGALLNAISSYRPEFPQPPFEVFMKSYSPEVIQHFIEMVFHTCYFVTATAYDFEGVARKKKIPLWQTRMAIEAQGVSMEEILRPLIINTAPFIGREKDPGWVTQRLDRRGNVEIGDATLVEEAKPGSTTKP